MPIFQEALQRFRDNLRAAEGERDRLRHQLQAAADEEREQSKQVARIREELEAALTLREVRDFLIKLREAQNELAALHQLAVNLAVPLRQANIAVQHANSSLQRELARAHTLGLRTDGPQPTP